MTRRQPSEVTDLSVADVAKEESERSSERDSHDRLTRATGQCPHNRPLLTNGHPDQEKRSSDGDRDARNSGRQSSGRTHGRSRAGAGRDDDKRAGASDSMEAGGNRSAGHVSHGTSAARAGTVTLRVRPQKPGRQPFSQRRSIRVHILHVVYECVPNAHHGGITKIVLELAKAQASGGHEVEIATLGGDHLVAEEQHLYVRIRRFRPTLMAPRAHSLELSRTLRAESGIDIVHAHNTFLPMNITARRIASRVGAPLVVTPHGTLDPRLLRDGTLRALKKRCYIALIERQTLNAAHAVIVNTDEEAAWVRSIGVTSSVHVIPNGTQIGVGYDELGARQFAEEWELPSTAKRILFIGRINPKKQILRIVEAFDEVRRVQPNTYLLIAGDRAQSATYVAQIDAAIARRDLTDSVRWLGFLDETAKAAAYHNASLFVHASISEGMPMSVLEAMGAGLACVVTPGTMMSRVARLGGVLEVGEDELAEALTTLLGDDTARTELAKRARSLANSTYSWSSIAATVCATYHIARSTDSVAR